jgi:hypothetical protein
VVGQDLSGQKPFSNYALIQPPEVHVTKRIPKNIIIPVL